MAITETYFDPDLATGLNDGTSEANAWQTWAQMQTDHVAGERVNAKKTASRYAPGADIAFAVSATDLLASVFRGYSSTIGDGVKFEFDLGATFTLTCSAKAALVQSIDVIGSDNSQLVNMSGDQSRIDDFNIVNTGTSVNNHQALTLNDSTATNGYAESNSTKAGGTGGAAVWMTRSTIENCEIASTRLGVYSDMSSRAGSIVDCLIYAKGAGGINGIYLANLTSMAGGINTGLTIEGFTNSIYLPSVMRAITGTTPLIISDSILANATVAILNVDTATLNMAAKMKGIAFFNCGTDSQMGDNEIENKISLTVDPFIDVATLDYNLNNTAGGGADCRGAVQFGGV